MAAKKNKVRVKRKSSDSIVAELEKPHSKEFTEAAHAEMMRRFIVELQKFTKESHRSTMIIITLTLFIVIMTAINLLIQYS